jgi:hypothetical protein
MTIWTLKNDGLYVKFFETFVIIISYLWDCDTKFKITKFEIIFKMRSKQMMIRLDLVRTLTPFHNSECKIYFKIFLISYWAHL